MRLNDLQIVAALAVLLTATTAAHAETCSNLNQSDMNACAYRGYQAADAALNATYRAIAARLKDEADTRQSLVAAQRAWVAFRDAECAFESSGVAGGSIRPTIEANCLEAVTRARAKNLQAFLRCTDGDLGCPVPAR